MKKTVVLGASGATGRLLVRQLLQKGFTVLAIVRNSDAFINNNGTHPNLQIIEAEIANISADDWCQYLKDCEIVLCCLGHNLTFNGVFGKPRRLVTEAIKNVTTSIVSLQPKNKIKLILMNTTGNQNQDIPEKPPFTQRAVIFVLRMLLPPHVDNEKAAEFLRLQVGQNNDYIDWVVVRPDTLTNEELVTEYAIHISPIRNVIFDAGSTSRINVADFMSELAVNSELWSLWQGQMPVIYNQVIE